MELDKKPFVPYELEDNKKKAPIPLRLNDKEEEMVTIGRYMLNMESKGGVLKHLANVGLNVLLKQIGAEEMHRLTNPRRRKLVQEEPKYHHYNKN